MCFIFCWLIDCKHEWLKQFGIECTWEVFIATIIQIDAWKDLQAPGCLDNNCDYSKTITRWGLQTSNHVFQIKTLNVFLMVFLWSERIQWSNERFSAASPFIPFIHILNKTHTKTRSNIAYSPFLRTPCSLVFDVSTGLKWTKHCSWFAELIQLLLSKN